MAFSVGDLIDGHYRVEQRFEGGMGYVYVVFDELVGKRFAIKQLPDKHARNQILQERFRREASAWLLLDYHPHIVQAYSFHPRPEGPMLILEYIDGPSLDRVLRSEKRLSQRQAIAYARQVCAAMQHAHNHPMPDGAVGVLHRDIKPGNLLITRRNLVKVTDFGLAKIIGDTQMTDEGVFVGTLAYSSPEQLRGAAEVGRASDVYSLAAVLYQMTTGRPPFVARTIADMFELITTKAPIDPRQLRPELDPRLAHIIIKCLSKKPEDRYQEFGELDAALAETADGACTGSDEAACTHCGFISLSRGADCIICREGKIKAIVGDVAVGWRCQCGRHMPWSASECPNCGRLQDDPLTAAPEQKLEREPAFLSAVVLSDEDAPLPVPTDLDVTGPAAKAAANELAELASPASYQPSVKAGRAVERKRAERGRGVRKAAQRLQEAKVSAGTRRGSAASEELAQVRATLVSSNKSLWEGQGPDYYLVELGTKRAWRLHRSSYSVGRGLGMTIRIEDPCVARFQMFLVRLPCGWIAINPDPTSSMEINGQERSQHLLRGGDAIRLGGTWLALVGPDPGQDRALELLAGRWPERVAEKLPTEKCTGSSVTAPGDPASTACTIGLPGGGRVVSRGQPLRIGRASLCDVRINEESIEPLQAIIIWQQDGPHLINLGSAGVVCELGGNEIRDRLLRDGDLIQVGSQVFKVSLTGDPLEPARQQRAAMSVPIRFAITVLRGPDEGRSAVLPAGQALVLGRQHDCDIIIRGDQHVSRHHLKLMATGRDVDIQDLGSRNGFFINQTPYNGRAVARLGHLLRIGKTILLVHYELPLRWSST